MAVSFHVTPSQCCTQEGSQLVCYTKQVAHTRGRSVCMLRQASATHKRAVSLHISTAHKRAASLCVTPSQCRTQEGGQLACYLKPVPHTRGQSARAISLYVTQNQCCTQECSQLVFYTKTVPHSRGWSACVLHQASTTYKGAVSLYGTPSQCRAQGGQLLNNNSQQYT